jgi:hypothetical protein
MEENLISRLRNSHAIGLRGNIAIDLAKTGSDWACLELIRMAEGRVRRRGLFGCLFNLDYEEQDQLNAIFALGETGNKIALDYLKKVYSVNKGETNPGERIPGGWFAYFPWFNSYSTTNFTYPNAPKNIKELLSYKETQVNYKHSEKQSTKDENIHSVFIGAIDKLEEVF